MPKGNFQAEAFYAALDGIRLSRRLTWKKIAEDAGVSASTLTRMAQGKRPDVDTLAALSAWSRLNVDDYVEKNDDTENESEDTLTKISAYLRADKNLTQEGAAALEAIIKAGYEQLRQDENKKEK